MKKILALTTVAAVLAVPAVASATPVSRANAVRAAKQYVQIMPFSDAGLIDQLHHDGFSFSDAVYGVEHSGANWNREAVQAAKQYLGVMPFSRSGLVAQLAHDGFSHTEAVAGVRAVGL